MENTGTFSWKSEFGGILEGSRLLPRGPQHPLVMQNEPQEAGRAASGQFRSLDEIVELFAAH